MGDCETLFHMHNLCYEKGEFCNYLKKRIRKEQYYDRADCEIERTRG